MKENEGSNVRQQPAKRPAQTGRHAQKSLTVPKSPRLGRLKDQVKQVTVRTCNSPSNIAYGQGSGAFSIILIARIASVDGEMWKQ